MALLRKKGTKYCNLSLAQKVEIQNQMPRLVLDNNKENYRFYYSDTFKCWIITNAMAVP